MNPRVNKILEIDFPFLLLQFTNGEIRQFSCEPYLHIGVFKEFQDERYFLKAVASAGTVVWPHDQDFCPDTLYLESKAVEPAAVKKGTLIEIERAGSNWGQGEIKSRKERTCVKRGHFLLKQTYCNLPPSSNGLI